MIDTPYAREWRERRRAKNKSYNERFPERRLMNRYGLSRDEALAALAAKPRGCQLCGREVRLHYDHCHRTGRFRGWLCASCNRALGLMQDDPERLRAAVRYLLST